MTKQVKAALEQVNEGRRKILGMMLAGAAVAPLLTSTALAATGTNSTKPNSKFKQKPAAAPVKTQKPSSSKIKTAPSSVKNSKGTWNDGGKPK